MIGNGMVEMRGAWMDEGEGWGQKLRAEIMPPSTVMVAPVT